MTSGVTRRNEFRASHNTQTPMIPRHSPDLRREPSHDEIAKRAYQLFEHRGCVHGHEMDDWVQAEKEIRAGGK